MNDLKKPTFEMFKLPEGVEPAIELECENGHKYLAINEEDECDVCRHQIDRAETRARAILEGSGLPSMFSQVGISDFIAETKEQKAVLGIAFRILKGHLPAGALMCGNVGTGKTMLAAGLINDWRRSKKGKSPCWCITMARIASFAVKRYAIRS